MENIHCSKLGLFVQSSYYSNDEFGLFLVSNLGIGEFVAAEIYRDERTSNNTIALLGIIAACKYCIRYKNFIKIYTSNETSYNWALEKKFNPNESSPEINSIVQERLQILSKYDFSEKIVLIDKSYEILTPDITDLGVYNLDKEQLKSDIEEIVRKLFEE